MACCCFVPCAGKFNTSKCIGKVLNRGSTCSHYSIKPFILIMTVLSALLIMAGDVELNPGPRGFRKCPQCEQQVPVKCKTCTNCGLSFTSRKSTEAKKTQWNKDYYQTKKMEILAQRKETYSKHAEEFKIASKMNYDANPTRKLVTACARYKINPEEKKAASVARYKINPEKQKTAYVARYKINPENQKAASVARYKINPEKQKAASVARYKINPEKQKTAYVARYKINPEKQKAASVARYKITPEKQKAASVARYKINPEKQKAGSVARYKITPEKQKAASVARYKINPEKQKAASIAKYKTKSKQLKSIFKTNYAENKKSICEYRRSMYILAEPKPDVKQQYVKQIQYSLLHDSQTLVQLIKDYKKQHPDFAKRMSRAMSQAVCKIAAKKVLNKALQLRKENVGYLLKNIRLIKCLDIKENEDFGEGVHSAASEPYYFDASYRLVKIDFPIQMVNVCSLQKIQIMKLKNTQTNP